MSFFNIERKINFNDFEYWSIENNYNVKSYLYIYI